MLNLSKEGAAQSAVYTAQSAIYTAKQRLQRAVQIAVDQARGAVDQATRGLSPTEIEAVFPAADREAFQQATATLLKSVDPAPAPQTRKERE